MQSLPYEKRISYSKQEEGTIKLKMLNWLRPFSIFVYLDNNNYAHAPNRFEALAALSLQEAHIPSLPDDNEIAGHWHFGHISYDYKNHLDAKLNSTHMNYTGFEECSFFKADKVAYIPFGKNELVVGSMIDDVDEMLEAILSKAFEEPPIFSKPDWQYRFTKEEYIKAVQTVQNHIVEGDCYELNFCTESYAENMELDAVSLFQKLNSRNPSPFACCYRNGAVYVSGASPERFIYKEENTLVSQPIKGTARRGKTAEEDAQIKIQLRADEKERAENVMITDLVRNDLAKSCIAGSIEVPELFGVYTLPQVHQLISTVNGTIADGVSIKQAIEHAFPMGSMTGAPKQIVMQLTERYERSRRNIYAGTIGYILPDGNFDFNVVIRSLVYNSETGYLSYHTGGAITFDSDPEKEWEEVRLKARAMEQIFE